MTTFIITVPSTSGTNITDSTRSALESALASQHTNVSESEGLVLLTLNEDGTFSVRLEVEARDRYEAELNASRILSAALRKAGIEEFDAPLGLPAVNGIDSDL